MAHTLYEAIAIKALRAEDWPNFAQRGQFTVHVIEPITQHTVQQKDFSTWLNRTGGALRLSGARTSRNCSDNRGFGGSVPHILITPAVKLLSVRLTRTTSPKDILYQCSSGLIPIRITL